MLRADVGGGEVGLDGVLLRLLTRQSVLRDANIFIS